MKWIPYVMVRIAAFFIAGVLTGIYFPRVFSQLAATVFLTILVTVYLVGWPLMRRRHSSRLAFGLVGLTALFVAGIVVVQQRDKSKDPNGLVRVTETVEAYRVRVISPPERREKSWRMSGEILAVKTSAGWMTCRGKLLLYWPTEERADTLRYGDVLLVTGSPRTIDGPQNPDEFDYKTFLAHRQIFHQHYVRAGQWLTEARTARRDPIYYATEARRWTLEVINRIVQGDRERAIVAAFVIGVTDGIDDDLKKAYAAGGAMHALAVSGMHVSILYGVLLFLLKPMERRRAGKWTVAILSLSLLWMYGFVTGLTPSVLRAVTMFSFVAMAKPLGRSGSILNTLAASAFVLILFDPWLICAAGFQLSYLAVLGIVLLYRPIYHLMEFRWAWADWIWQITCVSIAAQVATLPVTLYYFHQFPPWFLLANLFVIPASTVILLGGILLLLFSPIALVAGLIARGLECMIWLLNEGLFMVGELPFSLVFPIPITFLQALCLGTMIIGVFGFFRTKKFHWMWLVLSLAIIYSLEDWRLRFDNESEFVVYRVPGQVGMEWQVNQQSLAVLDTSLVADARKVSFHLLPHRVARRIQKAQTLAPDQDGTYFVVQGLHFLRIASPGFVPPDHLETDYLIIGNNAVPSLETLNRTLTFDQVILDSSNSLRYTERLTSEAEKLGVSCHSVLQQGAFVLSMKN